MVMMKGIARHRREKACDVGQSQPRVARAISTRLHEHASTALNKVPWGGIEINGKLRMASDTPWDPREVSIRWPMVADIRDLES